MAEKTRTPKTTSQVTEQKKTRVKTDEKIIKETLLTYSSAMCVIYNAVEKADATKEEDSNYKVLEVMKVLRRSSKFVRKAKYDIDNMIRKNVWVKQMLMNLSDGEARIDTCLDKIENIFDNMSNED